MPCPVGVNRYPKCAIRATSAFPPIATIERTSRHVSNVPRSDIGASFDHLVGGDQQGLRNGQSKGFGSLEVDHLFQAGRLPDRQVRGAAPQ